MTRKVRDERLAQFDEHLTGMADTLIYWLDQQHAYSALSIYFLAGVLRALIEASWPDEATRPAIYSNLMMAIDDAGAQLGPAIKEIELDGLPELVRSERKKQSAVN